MVSRVERLRLEIASKQAEVDALRAELVGLEEGHRHAALEAARARRPRYEQNMARADFDSKGRSNAPRDTLPP